MTDNEKLIEKAKQAIHDYEVAKARRVSVSPDRLAALLAEMVAAFEKAHVVTERHSMSVTDSEAHTPTDDEREALRIAGLDARQAAYRHERENWWFDHETAPDVATNAWFRGWDAAVAAGFRRSEVPEPSAEPTCEHGSPLSALCDYAARYASGETDDAEPKHAAQGEPSDAQVLAAMEAYAEYRESDGPGDAMRAALRAAGEVNPSVGEKPL